MSAREGEMSRHDVCVWREIVELSIDFLDKFMGLTTQGRKTELHYSCTIAANHPLQLHHIELVK